MPKANEIQLRPVPDGTADAHPDDSGPRPDSVEAGQWYWVTDDDGGHWFGCVTHVGSNYAEMESPVTNGSVRIHLDKFQDCCEHVEDPDTIIDGNIARYGAEVRSLMGEIKDLTARLSVSPSPALQSGSESRALAAVSSSQDVGAYKAALIKAKKEDLPALFDGVKAANKNMASWMSAKVIPLKAQAKAMHGVIDVIEDRIFSIELYAGLVEQVVRIRDGEPAPLTEKVRLVQRRHYMDEECLVAYEAGGMEFKDLGAFDRWLAKDANLDRLLPFPRCLVAFQVRRRDKEREVVNLSDFINLSNEITADKSTFLYVRNGGQVFRMSTGVDFDEKLFPDMERSRLSGKLWAKTDFGRAEKIISDDEYQGLVEDDRMAKAEWKEKLKAWKKDKKAGEKVRSGEPWEPRFEAKNYSPFDHTNVLYDDIAKRIEADIRSHNRIALIVQGLLDRSPVLHPHPPWQIWTQDGFKAALELIYDESRALPAGPIPDFDAYRARLNAMLKVGCVTVGQEVEWEKAEAEKECRRLDNDYRNRSHWRPSRFTPHGDPGPGTLARVSQHTKSGKCTYRWIREKRAYDSTGTVPCTFTTDASKVLNVDAYKAGDFHIFFDDPRTRSEYLGWAWMLLEAEEYHAGNRKVADPPKPAGPVKSSYEGRQRYEMRKKRKALIGKAVRIKNVLETKGGDRYEAGTLWRVSFGSGRAFSIYRIKGDGTKEEGEGGGYVRNVHSYDFEVDPSIPPAPKAEKE